MWKRILWGTAVLGAGAMLAPAFGFGAARAQAAPPEPPTIYTYVAEWGIPRAQWNEFDQGFARNSRPKLEKLLANGTIVSWGAYAYFVHDGGGLTHGDWWQATSLAGIIQARDAIVGGATFNPALENAKHVDHLFRAVAHGARAGASGTGLLWVARYTLKPGQLDEFTSLFKRNIQPFFDPLVADGTVTLYEFDVQAVHSENPNEVDIAYLVSSPEGVDKVLGGIRLAEEKNPLVGKAFAAMTEGETHRDLFANVTAYAHQ